MVKTSRTGIYYNLLENGDKVFYFNFKDVNDSNKLKWVKVGNYSNGFREINAFNLRNEQISKMKHGKDITVIANKKKKDVILFEHLALRYFEDKKSTNERKQKYYNHIKEFIGSKQIENILKIDITKIINSVIDKNLSNGTANSILSLISTIFNHSIKQHSLRIINPCIGIARLKDDNKRDRYLTTKEIKKLKDEIKSNFFVNLFVELSLSTGGRLETILHIQKKDINLENKTINLNNLKTQKRYTGFLQDDLIEILKDYLPLLNPNDYVITQKGLHYKKADVKQIHRRLKPILDRLFNKGLKDDDITNRAVIHTLRHTFASHLAINGTPIFTIQKLLNHSDIKQTMRYAKLSPTSGLNEVQGLYK